MRSSARHALTGGGGPHRVPRQLPAILGEATGSCGFRRTICKTVMVNSTRAICCTITRSTQHWQAPGPEHCMLHGGSVQLWPGRRLAQRLLPCGQTLVRSVFRVFVTRHSWFPCRSLVITNRRMPALGSVYS